MIRTPLLDVCLFFSDNCQHNKVPGSTGWWKRREKNDFLQRQDEEVASPGHVHLSSSVEAAIPRFKFLASRWHLNCSHEPHSQRSTVGSFLCPILEFSWMGDSLLWRHFTGQEMITIVSYHVIKTLGLTIAFDNLLAGKNRSSSGGGGAWHLFFPVLGVFRRENFRLAAWSCQPAF